MPCHLCSCDGLRRTSDKARGPTCFSADSTAVIPVTPCAGFFTLFLLGGFAGGVPRFVLACEPAPANMRLLRQNIEMCGAAEKVLVLCLQGQAALGLMTSLPASDCIIGSCMKGASRSKGQEKDVEWLQIGSTLKKMLIGASTPYRRMACCLTPLLWLSQLGWLCRLSACKRP